MCSWEGNEIGTYVNIFRNSKSNFELDFRIVIQHLYFIESLNLHPLCIAFPSTHQKTTNTTPQRLRKSKRPTNDAERCKFRFNVYFSDEKSRWFFKKEGGGDATHIGHSCHLEDPKQVKATSTTLDSTMDEYENMFTNVNKGNNSDDELEGAGLDKDDDDNDDTTAEQHPYSELIPTLVSITDLIQTAGELAFVKKEMNQIYSALLSGKSKAGGPTRIMVPLPEIDQRRKDKRLKPMGPHEKR